ncbi:MAG: hypothetical protein K2Z81_25270 [Cyanobacteria bacterium]|nr:hypothetical protein [Cyanobacteriota bacterium]
MFQTSAATDPLDCERAFLTAVTKGDYKETVRLFGGNACNCPRKGGWVSYLIYSSAQEPNLAFMMGQPFEFAGERVIPIENENRAGGILPWQAPEDVVTDIDVSFKEGKYQPYFLPLKLAYGEEMTEEELNQFAQNPDKDVWRGFTLRLRPSLEPGVVNRPDASKNIEYKPDDEGLKKKSDGANAELSASDKAVEEARKSAGQPVDPNASPQKGASSQTGPRDDSYVYENLEDDIAKALGKDFVRYLHPQDPGKVVRPDGSCLSSSEIAKNLPRLVRAKLRLHIVRRGKLRTWTVYHLGVIEPQVKLSNGKMLELTSAVPPNFEKLRKAPSKK